MVTRMAASVGWVERSETHHLKTEKMSFVLVGFAFALPTLRSLGVQSFSFGYPLQIIFGFLHWDNLISSHPNHPHLHREW
jgi:hypothetical protein